MWHFQHTRCHLLPCLPTGRELRHSGYRNHKLNQFMFPREDSRGPQEGEWLEDAIERAQAQLASIRFDRP
jgi:hypothetical protein